jgi:multisubunit Na+/H+ antiporter MnhC subunit
MQAHEFEPMSIGRILDRTFKIYKDNFIRFITIVAIIQVPITLLMIISTSFLQRGVPARNEANSRQSSRYARQF